MRRHTLVLVWLLAACGSPEKPTPLGRMNPSGGLPELGSPLRSDATGLAVLSAQPGAPASAPIDLDMKIVTLRVAGSESRMLALGLRAALPRLRACFEKASPQAAGGWLDISLSVDAKGVASAVKTKGDLAKDIGGCAESAISAQIFEPKEGRAAATIEAGIRFTTVDEKGRPSLSPNDGLFRAPDGTCLALEIFDCPANKQCAAPKERAVACPNELGLPEIAKPGSADRRVDLAVSGGKPGQNSERLVLSRVAERCSVFKTVGGDDPVDDASVAEELTDAPCADFDRAWNLAQQKFGAAKATTKKSAHALTRAVGLWQMGKDGVPVVSEVRWTGENKKLDSAFSELVGVAAAVAKKRGVLVLGRLRE